MTVTTNLTDSANPNPHSENDAAHGQPTAILFIFFSCALGAFIRTFLKKVRLPYTVVLMLVGCIVGLMSRHIPLVAAHTTLASLDPHIILNVFLPVLIFESAFAMEIHMFMKSFVQIIVLAIPGFLLASFLTCLISMYVFSYNWSWEVGMVFGSLVSATDPVAVVALLKEVGASKQLSTIIDGESLLNDGAAIVVFRIFEILAVPGSTYTGLDITEHFARVALGGPILGFFMGKLTTFWLVNIFNDAITEITITLCSTYLTFYIGEVLLNVSGVLAVVVLGLTVSSERTSISPEVEAFLHRFWEMLAYLATTLIFIMVGVIITEKAIHHSDVQDWFLLVAMYCIIFVIRALMLALFSPLLARIGYGMTWKSAAVMTWGGLRGAVGLALALMLLQNKDIDVTGNTQNKILLQCAGLVMLTLVINATTVAPLLTALGMNEISLPKRIAMASAVRDLKETALSSQNSFKTDRFLADADWEVVDKYIEIDDPYKTVEEEAALDDLTSYQRSSTCPVCSTHVVNAPSAKEWQEMLAEARLRLLKAQKVSYWRQYEHGMLSDEAVRRLVELVDTATDSDANDKEGFINLEEMKKSWEVTGHYASLKARLERWHQKQKPNQEKVVWPKNRILKTTLKICMHPAFDGVLYTVIILNVIFVILEVVVEVKLCPAIKHQIYGRMFEIANYIFLAIYVIEATLKLMAYQVGYFKNYWNLFDFIILILSLLDFILGFTLFAGSEDSSDCSQGNISTFVNPGIVKVVKIVRLLRIIRSLRLIKGLIPKMISLLNLQISKKLRLGYDVGKGYITGEEDVVNNIDLMIDNRKIAKDLKHRIKEGKLTIMKELGQLQKSHPGIAVSIKTQQAAQRILNSIRDRITTLRSEGVLDEDEAHKLNILVEMKMKKLQKFPSTIQPPPPEKIIGSLSWVAGDVDLIEYIKQNSRLVSMQEGETLDYVESDPLGGIYVIICGLIQVEMFLEDYTHEAIGRRRTLFHSELDLDFDRLNQTDGTVEKLSDYMSTGSVLGEVALLSGRPVNTTITCDTSLQMYHVPYEAIQAALELFTEPPSLEYRLWRVAARRLAVPIVKKQHFFRNWGHDRIKMHLEKSVVVMKKWELSKGNRSLKPFVFDLGALLMSDVILIHGYAQSPDDGDLYQGPCYIPQILTALHLLPGRTEKHVLLIVSRDTSAPIDDEVQLSAEAEDPVQAFQTAVEKGRLSEAIASEKQSSLCLLHSARSRQELEAKACEHRHNEQQKDKDNNSLVRKVSSLLSTNTNQPAKTSSATSGLESGILRNRSQEAGINVQRRRSRLSPLKFKETPSTINSSGNDTTENSEQPKGIIKKTKPKLGSTNNMVLPTDLAPLKLNIASIEIPTISVQSTSMQSVHHLSPVENSHVRNSIVQSIIVQSSPEQSTPVQTKPIQIKPVQTTNVNNDTDNDNSE